MKRANTCGSTPMMTTERNGEPVARTASTGFIDISSTDSATSLERKPSDATISARMPASAPKPTDLTNRIATMTGCKLRNSAISARADHATGRGARLRAAASPSGSDRITPTTVAMIAICRLSVMPI